MGTENYNFNILCYISNIHGQRLIFVSNIIENRTPRNKLVVILLRPVIHASSARSIKEYNLILYKLIYGRVFITYLNKERVYLLLYA